MFKFIYNLAVLTMFAFAFMVVLGISELKGWAERNNSTPTVHHTHKKEKKAISILPQDIVGDIVGDVIEDASKNATRAIDSTVQNMGNQIVTEGSQNLDREVRNVSNGLIDSMSNQVQSQIEDALP